MPKYIQFLKSILKAADADPGIILPLISVISTRWLFLLASQ